MGLFGRKSNDQEEDAVPSVIPDAMPPAEVPPPKHRFGIDKAIALMRELPVDESNLELTVGIVKKTLEATDTIKVATIINDASRKQQDIQNRIAYLRQEVANFETEILKRNTEIELLEDDFAETSLVKERLMLAEGAPPEEQYEEEEEEEEEEEGEVETWSLDEDGEALD